MNENRIMQQVSAIFSVFMVFFYLGVGVFFIFYSDISTLPKPVRVIFGVTLLLYGLYRALRSYTLIRNAFFRRNEGSRREDRDIEI